MRKRRPSRTSWLRRWLQRMIGVVAPAASRRVHQRCETFVRDERLLKQEEENLEGDDDLRLQEVEKCRVISKRSQSSPPSHHHLRSNEVVTGANVGSYKEILEIRG
ncbi:hypothetical protein GQ457_02G022770 [Hibiscus cannabinus]